MSDARVEIVVDRRAGRVWHTRLRDRLARVMSGAIIRFRLVDGDNAFPADVERLLWLERALNRGVRKRLGDRAELAGNDSDSSFAPSVVIDCTGRDITSPRADSALILRPLYNGRPGETAAVAALLAGARPAIAVEDVASGEILATGLPSLEAADGLAGGLEAVASRIITLIEMALLSPRLAHERAPTAATPSPDLVAFFLRSLAWRCARQIYHLAFYSPHWRIGWRLNDGPGMLERGSLAGPAWRPLPDLGGAFAADPFPIEWGGKSYIFFEQLDHAVDKGKIFAWEIGRSGPIGEPFPVIEELWHLSYPFLIAQGDTLYMAPEASTSGSVSLYRCVKFPEKWERVADLLTGVEAADATIFQHAGRFWMTSVTRDGVGGYSDTLSIHHAPDLFGPWEEHARRPVMVDSRFARPAGAVVERDGALWRPIQDCSTGYGKKLAIARIDILDPERFSQTITATISPGPLWPGDRLHTLNRWGRLECIDGAVLTPKNDALRRMTHGRIDRCHPGLMNEESGSRYLPT